MQDRRDRRLGRDQRTVREKFHRRSLLIADISGGPAQLTTAGCISSTAIWAAQPVATGDRSAFVVYRGDFRPERRETVRLLAYICQGSQGRFNRFTGFDFIVLLHRDCRFRLISRRS